MTDRPLDLLILYYSCTGNTEFACEVARAVAVDNGHHVTMTTFENAGDRPLAEYDAFCFATPLQAWQPTKNVERFMKTMPNVGSKPAFVLSSSGGQPSQTAALMSKWLAGKGITVVGDHDLISPDSWPPTRRWTHEKDEFRPTIESILELSRFTERMLRLLRGFLDGKQQDLPRYRVYPTPLFILSRFARLSRGRPDWEMGKKKVLEPDCTKCGICRKNCPVGAIELDPYPLFSRECIACWRCINTCPEDCITTRLDNRQRHYKGIPRREELLKEAGLHRDGAAK